MMKQTNTREETKTTDLALCLLGIATANREDLRIIQDAFKARWNNLTKEEAGAFTVGQMVAFTSRSGQRIEGEVEKINRKTIGVKVGPFSSYRVSPSFLEVVE